ncbi:MAG: hypothetical protein HC830_15390 [Bacteroidetes bacterium]|nr:hypothetical protein [Bacteroidota bacterium]
MKLKRLMRNTLFLLTLAVVFSLTACKSGNTGTSDSAAADTVNKTELSQDVKDVVYPLPTPFEVTQMLNELGVKYNATILNPANKVEKYFTESSKAVNLGVYSADMAYAATYDQKQDIKLYSGSLKKLVDDLGINIDYNKFLSEENKEKFNNKDTLVKYITNTFFDTYQYLGEKSNPDLAIVMTTGMWVELMYIATHISEDAYNYTGIVKLITDQKTSYDKLMELLASRNSSQDIKDLETKLLVLKPVFDKIDTGLSEADYKTILTTIREVRKNIVS